nr:MAG TPA: tail protein [Caudoviricetes sp.]
MWDYTKSYFAYDKRVGEKCQINNLDAYTDYNADLKSLQLTPGAITPQYILQAGRCGFIDYGSTVQPKMLTAEFIVGGASDEQANENISNLLLAAKQCIIRRELHRFEYPAILTGSTVQESGVEPYYIVRLTFVAIQRLPLVSINITGPGVIFNDGNVPSGVRYILHPAEDLLAQKICGIQVIGIHAGKDFMIDGIEGRVMEDGNNRFADTDLINFPKIQPGKNEITMSNNMPVTVEFYPLFE